METYWWKRRRPRFEGFEDGIESYVAADNPVIGVQQEWLDSTFIVEVVVFLLIVDVVLC
jgi:hypothetical protein